MEPVVEGDEAGAGTVVIVWGSSKLFPVLVKAAAAMTIASVTTPPISQCVYLVSSIMSLRRFVFSSF